VIVVDAAIETCDSMDTMSAEGEVPRRSVQSREWLAAQLSRGHSVDEIAATAGVATATVKAWLRRQQIEVSPTPPRRQLVARYRTLGSIAALADELGVAPETARQRLIAAGVELKRPGRREGVHVVDVDVKALQRRRTGGQSLRSIAAEVGIDWRTVKKLLGEQGTESKGKRPVQKG
jgi:transposase-like protein